MKSRIIFLGLVASIISFGFIGLQKDGKEGIQFESISLEEAMKEAKSSNKLIFLDAYASWCGPCKWMDAHTFQDEKVGEFYNDNFINLKIDMEKGEGPNIARKYKVTAYPTLFFINKDGEVEKKILGAKPAKEFLEIGKNLLI